MDTGNNIKSKRGNWSFSGNVAENFVTHAEKSIPYYHEGHDLVCKLSDYFCVSNSLCYEIGSSTGQLTRKLAEYNKNKHVLKCGRMRNDRIYCGIILYCILGSIIICFCRVEYSKV